MAGDSGSVVRAQFDATNRRDWAAAMDAYAEDVELVVGSDFLLAAGTFHGREAVGQWFGDWFRTFSGGFKFDIVDLRDAGERAALWARHTARGSQSGVEVVGDFFYEYRVRAGKIVFVRFCGSWGEALETLALGQ
jgi:ketosteroid isomerase-like protein